MTDVEPVDPGRARTLDDLAEGLRSLKVWAGDPSYDTIKERVNAAWTAAGRPASELTKKTTVVDCFRPGRRRLNTDLVLAVVRALHPDTAYVTQWHQALRIVVGEARTAAQARVQDRLPPEPAGFTGRAAELGELVRTGAVSALTGMAGVGKTLLAVQAGHQLLRRRSADRVLFVDLRGFHPDPAQPPADPAAVLDGFLRLLGVPAQQVPHDLAGRTARFRALLAGSRTLVVLDNAAGADQVRPLLPDAPDCPVLVTSRRSLTDLKPAVHLEVDVFTAAEAHDLLARAAERVPVDDDPAAAARIAQRCGHLPLALGLVAGHMRARPGWTMADHADRLDERHQARRLDDGVELALDLSYQHLPPDRQRLLRLAALHPGHDIDGYAAAALAGTDRETAEEHLHHLLDDHLLLPGGPGRCTMHDLVRAYAVGRSHDEDPPRERHAALTRLFDFYLAAAGAAMAVLHPAEAHLRPEPRPAGTPAPDLTDPRAALGWLDAERDTLVAVVAHAATHRRSEHATGLARTLFRYLEGGHPADALTVHRHAQHAASDPPGKARALTDLGAASFGLGRYAEAAEQLRHALDLLGSAGDPAAELRARGNLGIVEQRLGRFRAANDQFTRVLELCRQAGNPAGEARTLTNLGTGEFLLGNYEAAAGHHRQALALYRRAGDEAGAAHTLNNLAFTEVHGGRHEEAAEHVAQALASFRRLGNRAGEANALDTLGVLHTRLGDPVRAERHFEEALAIVAESGDRDTEAWVRNGLGDAATLAGRPVAAITQHTAALATATGTGDRLLQAHAHAGLGRAHHTLGDHGRARHHYDQALTRYTDLGAADAARVRAHLAALDPEDS